MMKRNILAVVIPALLAAGSVNAAEIYNKDANKLDLNGRVHAGYAFQNKDADNEDNTYARLGFKGQTQISDELTGYGTFEYEFNGTENESDSGSKGKTRKAFAGLKFGDFGSFDYGRNVGVAYNGMAYTDVLPENGNDSGVTDTLTGRIGNAATFNTSDFFGLVDGLGFALQYVAEDNNEKTSQKDHGDAWATSLSYDTDFGVGVVASYGSYSRTKEQRNSSAKGDRADVWTAGLKYDANNIYVAAVYGEAHNFYDTGASDGYSAQHGYTTGLLADESEIFEVVAQYNFDFGLTPTIGYVSRKDKVANVANEFAVKYASVGATYAFNKNFSTYVEYDISLLDKNKDKNWGNDKNDRVDVGVIYQF
ncbi:porin [Pectobacterium cacticida]|uniref:porin n=1 Tax=Pectobacterium cacticida TaxID=69221 RepID=UPI002FF3EC72